MVSSFQDLQGPLPPRLPSETVTIPIRVQVRGIWSSEKRGRAGTVPAFAFRATLRRGCVPSPQCRLSERTVSASRRAPGMNRSKPVFQQRLKSTERVRKGARPSKRTKASVGPGGCESPMMSGAADGGHFRFGRALVPQKYNQVMPIIAESSEAVRIPNLACSCRSRSSNASWLMKRDMVNPMPPSQATPSR